VKLIFRCNVVCHLSGWFEAQCFETVLFR